MHVRSQHAHDTRRIRDDHRTTMRGSFQYRHRDPFASSCRIAEDIRTVVDTPYLVSARVTDDLIIQLVSMGIQRLAQDANYFWCNVADQLQAGTKARSESGELD